MTRDPPRDASLPPGYDADDPYEDVDLAELAAWWRESVALFREHDMRPYRPPALSDGALVPSAVDALEAEFDARVRFRCVEEWGVYVDGERVASVGRRRDGDGRTVYALSEADLRELVAAHVE